MAMMQFLQNMDQRTVFAVCLFGAVTAIAFLLLNLLMKQKENPLQERLQPKKPSEAPTATSGRAAEPAVAGPITATVQRISRAAAKPIMPHGREEQSKL